MTNEEIIKKFKFDLEMGRFTSSKLNCFTFDCNDKKILKRFERFLMDIGFKQYSRFNIDSVFNKGELGNYGIGIDCDDKDYWCYCVSKDSIFYDTKDNDVPDYIRDYKVKRYIRSKEHKHD